MECIVHGVLLVTFRSASTDFVHAQVACDMTQIETLLNVSTKSLQSKFKITINDKPVALKCNKFSVQML